MGLGKLWAEFKAFAFQGNMIELAVAVVIGGAFGGVVHSLVGDVIMPTVAYMIHTGEEAAEKAKEEATTITSKVGITSRPTTAATTQTTASSAPAATAAPAPAPQTTAAAPATDTQPVQIDLKIGPVLIGKFLTELINFLILAFAVFIMVVKLLGGVMKKITPAKPGEPTTRECPECLSIIPIKAKRCSHCTAEVPPVTPTPAPA